MLKHLVVLLCYPAFMFGQEVLIENTRNFLYVEFNNPIRLTTSYKCSEISLESKECTITKDVSNCNYYVTTKRPGNVVLIAYRVYKGEKIEIGRKQFRVKRMTDMVPQIGGQKSGLIDKILLASAKSMDVIAENTDIEINFKVLSYQVTIIKDKKIILDQQIPKGYITEDIQKNIRSLTSKDKVIFSEITIEDISKITFVVSPLVYVIK